MPYEYHEAAVLCLTFLIRKRRILHYILETGNAVRSSITAEIVAL